MTVAAPVKVRVPMVRPKRLVVARGVVDLRRDTDEASELVDQVQYGETLTLLGERNGWAWVQADDHYVGWLRREATREVRETGRGPIIAVVAAAARTAADPEAPIADRLAAGTPLIGARAERGWLRLLDGTYVSAADTVDPDDLPQRVPTADDLIATAETFLGVPYLWGGTSPIGIDCSGYVQRVYRLNGVGLDRDADQQALEGRPVPAARAGDLLFFGKDSVTHVALATSETDFLHAPQTGAFVERSRIGPARTPRAVRRYLMPDPA